VTLQQFATRQIANYRHKIVVAATYTPTGMQNTTAPRRQFRYDGWR